VPVDVVFRIEQPHRTGMLARVCRAIADGDGLIGDITTVSIGAARSVRDIAVELRDAGQAERLAEILGSLDEVRVLEHHDPALSAHEGGKLKVVPRVHLDTLQHLRDVYTPGVARVAQAIAEDPRLARRYTKIGRTVAICTNGTRVLGLGDIGPVAAMPVMEGKALLYSGLADLDAVPILITDTAPEAFVQTVLHIAPSFGAIHLEDIQVPECFEIESQLIDKLDVPVMQNDVHGAAVATLAAMLIACRQLGRRLASDPDRAAQAHALAFGLEVVELDELMARADIVVASTGVPGLIGSEQVRRGQVILALTNPDPEIDPGVALRAGAAFAADGTMVNDALAFPGIFRGALACGAAIFSTAMKLAAADAIARLAQEIELVPSPLDRRLHREVAGAVAEAARDEGLARPDRVPAGLES
jgi:malate dehydrogenase (oxaloacetate-decarboxylating)